jgi:hypothetical protein
MNDMNEYTYITKYYSNKSRGYLSICKTPNHQTTQELQNQS